RREVLPNAMAPLVSEFGLRFSFNFLFVAALSFLGLGVQPPYADWGGMVRENAAAINFGMYAPIWPALAIATLTVGVNLIVDWLLSIDARPSGAQAEM
ncbi:MAG: ABC transporter permease subunit, partial [Hyphomicrobiales bacterium]|nr:ABC transporter permease subunit [Hyphomicrobiales bacterium]